MPIPQPIANQQTVGNIGLRLLPPFADGLERHADRTKR